MPRVQFHTKFHMNLMKDVGRVGKTRFWMDKIYDNMGNNSGQKQSNQNSKITCTSSYHQTKVYKISDE